MDYDWRKASESLQKEEKRKKYKKRKKFNFTELAIDRSGVRYVYATATQSDTTLRSTLVRPIKTPLNQQNKSMLFLRFLANASKARSYRMYALPCPTTMQMIYWNNRKCLHQKRVELPQDWFGTPTWLPWLHVCTLHILWGKQYISST